MNIKINTEKFLQDYNDLIEAKNKVNTQLANDVEKNKRIGEQIANSYHLEEDVKLDLIKSLENSTIKKYNSQYDFDKMYKDISFYENYLIIEDTEETNNNPLA